MGAYENPRIITPPDYGEIFRRNFQASKQMVENAFARAEARREKIKREEQVIDDKILQFDLLRQDIKAGDLTGSLQNATNFLADDFAENERLYSQNQISREEYNGNRVSYFRKLNEMKQIGAFLEQQSKTIKDLDVSAFQKNGANAYGFLKAYQDNKIKFQFVGDDLEMYYLGGKDDKELIVVDSDNLKDANFFNLNEKNIITESEKKQLTVGTGPTQGFQTITNKDGKQITVSTKKYSKSKDELINDIANSNKMNEYFSDVEDAGSIFVDTIFNKNNVKSIEEDALVIAAKNGLSKDETEFFVKQIKTGTYEDMEFGEDKNYRQLVNEVSKLQLARDSFNRYAPKPQTATATEITDKDVTSDSFSTSLKNIYDKYTIEGQKNRDIATDQMDLEGLVNEYNKYKPRNGFVITKIVEKDEKGEAVESKFAKYEISPTDGNGRVIANITPISINLTNFEDVEQAIAGFILSGKDLINIKNKSSQTYNGIKI